MSNHGKVAIITGASSGIGRATAGRFAREGYMVVAVGRQAGALEVLVAEIAGAGGTAEAVVADVTAAD
ncbi:MAG: SDR family NAD(P)-dependent oxidoreductase, partial [Chloroflexota bacterium]